MTIEPFQRFMAISDVDVAQMVHLVTGAYHAVPAFDHVLVHVFHAAKAAAPDQGAVGVREPEHVLMPKMRVTYYPDVIHDLLYAHAEHVIHPEAAPLLLVSAPSHHHCFVELSHSLLAGRIFCSGWRYDAALERAGHGASLTTDLGEGHFHYAFNQHLGELSSALAAFTGQCYLCHVACSMCMQVD